MQNQSVLKKLANTSLSLGLGLGVISFIGKTAVSADSVSIAERSIDIMQICLYIAAALIILSIVFFFAAANVKGE
jgi:hypothetical protein